MYPNLDLVVRLGHLNILSDEGKAFKQIREQTPIVGVFLTVESNYEVFGFNCTEKKSISGKND